jgi:hypothetical protein
MRVAPFRGSSGGPMRHKCAEIDKKIERYWKLSAAISDRLALDGIKAAIEDLQAQKAALHPEQKQP